MVPEKYRGKPEFDLDTCIGCGACVNVCPTEALTQTDDLKAGPKVRKITLRYDTCIFCGNCADNCTTETGIKLSNQWDLAGMDRKSMVETHEYELVLCEKCGALIGTKKHLVWLYEKLGPLAYTNPSLLLAKSGALASESVPAIRPDGSLPDIRGQATKPQDVGQQPGKETRPSDFMRILCPKCKYELNIRL